MKKSELKTLLRNMILKQQVEENSLDFYKSLTKKELKAFVNQYGGFTKGKVQTLSFSPREEEKNLIPEGAFSFEAVLSDESINMNGYKILLSAWQEGFAKYFSDYEWLVYLQHDMDQPIGKTFDIAVDEEQQVLYARWFAYDDLTDKRISRGLVRDISTGHIPLEILYINKDTNEEKTPDEFFELMRDMVDRMFDEGKKWAEIREAIVALQELWVCTHTKVQIVEYSFVSVWANKNAEVKRINAIEKLNSEIPEDMEIEHEDQTGNEKWSAIEEDVEPSDDNLENEGGTPEASEDIAPTDSENEEEEKKTLSAEIEQLKSENEQLKQDKETLSAKIEELEAKQKYNNSRRVLIASTPKEELNIKTDDQLKASLWKILS
mgnify:CR=1 FL=1